MTDHVPTPSKGREPTKLEKLKAALGAHVLRAQGEDLTSMCARWGVTPPATFKEPGEITSYELEEGVLPESVTELAAAHPDYITLAGQIPSYTARPVDIDMGQEGEIGQPGTPIYSGVLGTEPTSRLQPYLARGFAGSVGVYDRHERKPLVYKTVQSIRELLVSGVLSLDPPTDCPEDKREEVEEACQRVMSALQHMPGGIEGYLHNAATCVTHGFSLFEVVWSKDVPHLPVKIAFREQSSVERWLLDEHARELMAVKLQTGGDNPRSYYLPVRGEELTHRRVLLNTLGGRGLNFEGIPPTRTVDVLIAKKELLLTIEAACAERFGAPILAAMADAGILGMLTEKGQSPDQSDWDDFFDALQYMLAKDTATMQFPLGLTATYIGPGGTMPMFKDQLEYIDSQIMLAFSAQGALLGQQSVHGSYALSQTADDDFMRSAPYYARVCTRSLNELIRHIFIESFGLDLPTYPRLLWRLAGDHDTSRWISDLATFMSIRDQLPPKLVAMGLEKLGAPADAFDDLEAQEEEEEEEEEEEGAAFADPTQLAEAVTPAKEAAMMDRAEAQIVRAFARLSRQMQARWRELIRDNTTSLDVLADREQLRGEFLPRFIEVVRQAMEGLGADAQDVLLKSLGVQGVSGELMLTDELMLLATSIGEEGFNRTLGVMTDKQVDMERGDKSRAVPVLAASTLALIASRAASSAYNAARTQVIERVAEGGDVRIWAERSSVLDNNTCSTCKALDGERVQVGTKRFYDLSPPNKCEGRHRCRCVWRFEVPEGLDLSQILGVLP